MGEYADYEIDRMIDAGMWSSSRVRRKNRDVPNECISNVKVVTTTDKAYLLKCKQGEFWVPKSIAILDDGDVYVPAYFEPKYLTSRKPPKAEDEFEVLD